MIVLATEPVETDAERRERWERERLMLDAGLRPTATKVLRGMSHGLTNTEIAADLGISEDSVKHHVRLIMRTTGARCRTHAVAIGFRRGWLT